METCFRLKRYFTFCRFDLHSTSLDRLLKSLPWPWFFPNLRLFKPPRSSTNLAFYAQCLCSVHYSSSTNIPWSQRFLRLMFTASRLSCSLGSLAVWYNFVPVAANARKHAEKNQGKPLGPEQFRSHSSKFFTLEARATLLAFGLPAASFDRRKLFRSQPSLGCNVIR